MVNNPMSTDILLSAGINPLSVQKIEERVQIETCEKCSVQTKRSICIITPCHHKICFDCASEEYDRFNLIECPVCHSTIHDISY